MDLEKNDDLKTKHQREVKYIVIIGITAFVAHTLVLYFIALKCSKEYYYFK